MKNILIFLFGAVFGAGGTLLWLRKDIKRSLEAAKNDAELPFVMGDETTPDKSEKPLRSEISASQGHSESGAVDSERERTEYHRVIAASTASEGPVMNFTTEGGTKPVGVPVMPRDDVNGPVDDSVGPVYEEDDDEENITKSNQEDAEPIEIDPDEFEHEDAYTKERLVYFRSGNVMSTENGAIIEKPAILVGTGWEVCVGNYENRTAYIRNKRLGVDYEIYVEDCSYEDEFGSEDTNRED